jgi:uncharacterized protein
MTLEGVVTNVTRFGAFIDLASTRRPGSREQLAGRFVKARANGAKVIVKVQVLSATRRPSDLLSMKALDTTPSIKPSTPADLKPNSGSTRRLRANSVFVI